MSYALKKPADHSLMGGIKAGFEAIYNCEKGDEADALNTMHGHVRNALSQQFQAALLEAAKFENPVAEEIIQELWDRITNNENV